MPINIDALAKLNEDQEHDKTDKESSSNASVTSSVVDKAASENDNLVYLTSRGTNINAVRKNSQTFLSGMYTLHIAIQLL